MTTETAAATALTIHTAERQPVFSVCPGRRRVALCRILGRNGERRGTVFVTSDARGSYMVSRRDGSYSSADSYEFVRVLADFDEGTREENFSRFLLAVATA